MVHKGDRARRKGQCEIRFHITNMKMNWKESVDR